MAVYTPPTETLPIFDNSAFPSSDGTALTIATGRNYFLTYPVAQGEEIFPSNITLQSSITDSTGSKGLSTQVLSSTGTGTQWVYSGLNGYSTYAMSSLPFTLPTTNFSNLYVLFTGTGSGILTIPISGFTTGTFLSIKNISSGTLSISTSTILFSSSSVTTSLITLFSPYTISLYFNGSNWIQTTVSSKMNDLELTGTLTTANLSFTGSLATDGITQTAGVSPVELYSTTTTKNIYLGGGLTTPVHTTGPIIIGSDSTATGGINIGTGTNQTTPLVNTVNIGSGTYGTNIKGTLGITGSTTVSSGSNLTLVSGNVSCTAGEIFAPTVRNSANSGSISTAGIVTGSSIVCPSYGPSSNSTDVSFCALATGNINIGTGTRTTSGKFINIGNGATSTSQINIGVSTNTTSIQGVLSTPIGTISGKTAYLEYNTGSALPTIDLSTCNLNITILFFSGSTPSGTCTLTNIQDNQIINLKNWNTNSTPISFTISQTTPSEIFLYQYGIDNGSTGPGLTSFSLAQGDSISIQKASGKLYQFASGSSFPNGITLPIRVLTPSISQLGYTNSVSNGSLVSVPANTLTDLLTTGTILPLGVLLMTFNITPSFSPTSGSSMSFSFNLSAGTTMIGVPANTTMGLVGSTARTTTFTYTIPVTTTATSNNAEIQFRGTTAAGFTASIPIGSVRISWVKIA